MTVETFFANFGHLADAPNGVQKLRELILQLAVQGKLVPQDPNDEPASVFLERIEAEKKRLKELGKIKKLSVVEAVNDEEIPFVAPRSWEWPRLETVCSYIQRGKGPKYIDKSDIPVVSQKCVQWAGFTIAPARFICPSTLEKYAEERLLRTGDLLWNSTGTGTIGRINVYKHEDNPYEVVVADSHVTVVRPVFLDSRYVWVWLASPYIQAGLEGNASGSTNQVELATSVVKAHVIPLPPLEEQKRIVAKVDQLMTMCDELEARQQKQQQGRVRLNNAALDTLLTAREPDEFADHWQRISTNFDLLYDHPETIAKLRAAILQLAVQGKLVPQDPNDEPAPVLLERIKAEKGRLVKEGKIRKQKPLPVIDEDLAPFGLPSGWAWARFPEVGEFGRGKSKHRPRNDPSLYSGGKYPMVQTGDVARANGEVKTYTALYNDTGLAQSRLWPKGTMCITIAANIADSAVLGFDACFPDSVVGLIASEEIGDVTYFEYFIRTAKEHLMDFAPSTAQKNINLGILETVFIPLPPLAEMKRIVIKIDQLIGLCDELEAKLNQAHQHSEKLMAATVRHLTS